MTMDAQADTSPSVEVARVGEAVACVTLNRPDARNALNLDTRRALARTFDEFAQDASIRAVVLTGAGGNFAAGADLREFADASALDIYRRGLHLLWASIARYPRPVIAAVEGFALGGGLELAMHCDLIVASETASLGQTEVRVGLMPGAGGTQRLVRLVGRQKAMLLLLTGDTISGAEAARLGLAANSVPEGTALTEAEALATRIAANPPLAVEQIKEVMSLGEDAPLDTALALERKAFQLLFASQDAKEGMSAFLEKRKPVYGRH